ncbi:MAG TPA: amidohydrolase family protein, partial [Acidimicrobiales bacterium]
IALAEVLPTDPAAWPSGVDLDVDGRPSGVLVRLDAWLRGRRPEGPPDVAAVGRWLAERGVTSVTDAGAANGAVELALLAAAGLDQHVTAMTRDTQVEPVPGIALGPVKVLLDDADLPALDDLTARISAAHDAGRAVAVHCVTDVQLVLALAAGLDQRDRVEHGSLVSHDLLPVLAAAGPTLVVQPGLVLTRGDRYLAEVDPADLPGLHRLRSFVDAGLPVALSSDAPYGPPDPWVSIAAAVDRQTADGAVLGAGESLDPLDALARFTGPSADPANPARLVPGAPADLVVLDNGWDQIGHLPRVAATLIAGHLVAGQFPR